MSKVMKELSIEEKAQRYDEAINEIRNLRDMLLKEGVINKEGIICDNFNRIFPELKESEDTKIRRCISDVIKEHDWSHIFGVTKNDCLSWIEKQGGQKPAEWSDEDEKMMKVIIEDIHCGADFNAIVKCEANKREYWLKSLKNRVQPQPKQEWSEEDEKLIKDACCYVNRYGIFFEEEDQELANRAYRVADRLRTLIPQNRWKPSDDQMDALWDSIKHNLHLHPVLKSLYNELKKLKEE